MASPTDPSAVAERLKQLERRLVVTFLGAVAAVVLATASVVLVLTSASRAPAPAPGSVSYSLVDAEGRTHATFANDDSGHPGLFIREADGQQRLGLGLTHADEPALRLFDEEGQVRLQAVVDDGTDAPSLVFKDGRGRSRVVIGLDENGQGGVEIRDASGSVTWAAR